MGHTTLRETVPQVLVIQANGGKSLNNSLTLHNCMRKVIQETKLLTE